ncbi:MAG TPA: DUF2252 domain-containing protein [Gemmatales bacterium]|nr:DUF2252 domain-containing protein [Gemmatales bacterium]
MSKNGKANLNETEIRSVDHSFTTRKELYAQGKSLRDKCPRASHAKWVPAHDRHDPIHLLEESSKGRMLELIPIRYGRMMQSPFTFYRGSAMNMAADLATTPTNGLRVQACGDAHLCNFGVFATPERRIIADINDLDETLPAPWEWDVKRLTASFVVASRFNGHSEEEAREAALSSVRAYRESMAEFSKMRVLDVWYASLDVEKIESMMKDEESTKRFEKRLAKARERSVAEYDFPELVTTAGLKPMIKEDPPLIFHLREQSKAQHEKIIEKAFAGYRDSLSDAKRLLLDRYQLIDIAAKVVGVGSVGTYCAIMLMMASEKDPLFLQIKQARQSVLEPYAGKSIYANHGQRVVVGHHLMQSASDLFLGWTEGHQGRQFYIRQLKDMKIKPMVEIFTPSNMRRYGELCGWLLAHSHARSDHPSLISGYLGKGDSFDEAVADFSVAYADQAERDHETLVKAVRSGRLEAFIEGV